MCCTSRCSSCARTQCSLIILDDYIISLKEQINRILKIEVKKERKHLFFLKLSVFIFLSLKLFFYYYLLL